MDAQRNETNTAVIAPGSAGDHADTDSGDALPAQTALLAVDVRVAIEGVGTYRDVRIIRGEGSNPCPYEDRRSIDAVAVGFRTGKTNQTEQRTVLEDIRYAEAELLRSSTSYRTLVGTSSSAEGDVSMTASVGDFIGRSATPIGFVPTSRSAKRKKPIGQTKKADRPNEKSRSAKRNEIKNNEIVLINKLCKKQIA